MDDVTKDITVAKQAADLVQCSYEPATSSNIEPEVIKSANDYLAAFFRKYMIREQTGLGSK